MHPDTTTTATPVRDDTPPVAARRVGHLYPRVAAHLAAHPGQVLKVGEITRAIGAPSSGAVFEACKRMAAAGYAIHHSDPHRFEVTPAGIAGAATLPPPAPRTTTANGRARRQPVRRPNGELYFPRRLAGGLDVQVLRRLRDKRIPVLLYGPPGTGKTAMVEAAFDDLITLAGTGDTLVEDFVGSYTPLPEAGGYEYVYGPLVTAMREGRALLVDDATLIPPRVLSVLYPAIDGRHVITLTSYRNERVEATDGFYVIAAHNPGVHQAILTDALASRFLTHVEVSTDWDLARHLGAPGPVIAAAVELNQMYAAGLVAWAPQLREVLGLVKVRKAIGLAAAVGNLAGRAPEDDREQVKAVLAKHTGTTVRPLAVGTRH